MVGECEGGTERDAVPPRTLRVGDTEGASLGVAPETVPFSVSEAAPLEALMLSSIVRVALSRVHEVCRVTAAVELKEALVDLCASTKDAVWDASSDRLTAVAVIVSQRVRKEIVTVEVFVLASPVLEGMLVALRRRLPDSDTGSTDDDRVNVSMDEAVSTPASGGRGATPPSGGAAWTT